ncbi:MAG: hypothetical protein AAFS10_02145 [Myxococcota bacterium]
MMISRLELMTLMTSSALAGGLVLGALLLTLHAAADGDPATDNVTRVIPYHGVLKFNGEPVTATGENAPWLRLNITDGSGPEAPVIYAQSVQVNVYAGRFTALLGPTDDNGADIDTAIARADNLHLRMTVLNTHNPNDPASTADDDVALMHAQPLGLTPYAVWATHATDFEVAQGLTTDRADIANLNTSTLNTATVRATDATVNALPGEISLNSRLRLDSPDANSELDTFADFKLLLHTGNSASASNGWTARNGALVANVASGASYDFYQNGSDLLLRLSSAGSTLNTGLEIPGNLTVFGHLRSNTAADPVFISSAIQTDGVDLQGSIVPSQGAVVTFDDPVVVNDGLEVGGSISDPNDFEVRIDENVTVNGRTGFGIVVRRCTVNSSPFDCACNADEAVIGGGGYGSGDAVLRLSRPALVGDVMAWRVACMHSNGNDSGQDTACNRAYAICAQAIVTSFAN